MKRVRVAAIIPARMNSSRFPRKALLRMEGLPMVEHVRRRALRCAGFSDVVVATCDQEIADVIRGYGGRCVMTSPDHPTASDRVAEAMGQLDCTHVVNVQGDEILVLPGDLERLVQAIEAQPELPAWNALGKLERAEELSDPSLVKCVISGSRRILYCSRNFVWLGEKLGADFHPVRMILGILGFRRDFLERYGKMPRGPLECAEPIDQTRVIEHDVVLQGVEFSKGYPGINVPREAEVVQRLLSEDPAQQAMLQEILSG